MRVLMQLIIDTPWQEAIDVNTAVIPLADFKASAKKKQHSTISRLQKFFNDTGSRISNGNSVG